MDESNRFDLGVIFRTARQVVTQPVAFFQSMPTSGGYANPVIFVLVMAAVSGLVMSVYAMFGGSTMTQGLGLAGTIFSVFLVPVFVVIGSFFAAIVLFILWKLMGSTGDFQTAYRCLAFSSAILPIVAVASIVPYLGQALHTVWGTLLMIVASQQVHKISRNKALVVFGVLGALSLYSSMSSEYRVRSLGGMASEFKAEFEHTMRQPPTTTPAPGAAQLSGSGAAAGNAAPASQLGKAANDFLSGLQEGSGDLITPEEQAELARAGEAVGKFIETMEQSAQQLQDKDIDQMTAKDAGANMGALLKSLQEAASTMQADMGVGLAGAPVLASIDTDQLHPLGSIATESRRTTLQLAINDDQHYAPLTKPAKIFRDDAGIRYQLWLSNKDMQAFAALGGPAAGSDEVTVRLRNAAVYVYDADGNILNGDQCQQSLLQIPAASAQLKKGREQEFWLWCPQQQRQQMPTD
jgi:hypothetical protein